MGQVVRKGQAAGCCSGWGHRRGTYHGHLFFEVIQVPALLALTFLGRTLVIFLVLRGGDTIAVRATRLRARRDSRGTPALRALARVLAAGLSLGVTLCLSGPPYLIRLASLSWAPCVWDAVPSHLHMASACASLSISAGLLSQCASFCLSLSSSNLPVLLSLAGSVSAPPSPISRSLHLSASLLFSLYGPYFFVSPILVSVSPGLFISLDLSSPITVVSISLSLVFSMISDSVSL